MNRYTSSCVTQCRRAHMIIDKRHYHWTTTKEPRLLRKKSWAESEVILIQPTSNRQHKYETYKEECEKKSEMFFSIIYILFLSCSIAGLMFPVPTTNPSRNIINAYSHTHTHSRRNSRKQWAASLLSFMFRNMCCDLCFFLSGVFCSTLRICRLLVDNKKGILWKKNADWKNWNL